MSPSYDAACYELADTLLAREGRMKTQVDAARCERLAQVIQDAVDGFLADEADDAREAGQ